MIYRLDVRPEAIADVQQAAAYIARGSMDHAMRLFDAVDATYVQIRRTPEAWPKIPDLGEGKLAGLRHRSVIGFQNYQVVYKVQGNGIIILRVLHAARDIAAILRSDTGEEHDGAGGQSPAV